MKKSALAIILTAIAISSASGFEYKLGYDFGNPFDENNNYSPICYPFGIGNLPSPGLIGEGGEKFDLEGFHFAMEGNTVHLALVNSFGTMAHSTYWNQDYAIGDIFFGFDGNNSTYAIDLFEGKLYQANTYSRIPNLPGTYYPYTDIRNAIGAYNMTSGNMLGSVNYAYTKWEGLESNPLQGNGDTWVLEFSFDKSLLGDISGTRAISFHNTLACGNDVINKSFAMVPEPTTILLFGLGMMGFASLRKRN
jgi:hypothetical protein